MIFNLSNVLQDHQSIATEPSMSNKFECEGLGGNGSGQGQGRSKKAKKNSFGGGPVLI